MANCKELHPDIDGQPTQAYKDCVAKNENNESELSPMQKAVNKNRAAAGLEPQDNSNKVYDSEKDDNKLAEIKPSIFENFLNKVNVAKEAIDTTLDIKEKVDKKNILEGIQINDDIYLPEDSEEVYKASFIETLGAGLSSNKINEMTPAEDKQFSRLAYDTAMYKHRDNPDYKPSVMEINAEAYRLKALAITKASGEESTKAEQLLGKSNPVAGLFSDIYRSIIGGVNSTSALDGIYGIYSSSGELGDQEVIDYVESYKDMLEANQTSDAMRDYQADVDKGDGSIISSMIAIAKNPMVLPDVGISSMTMMASSVVESDFVKANAAAGMVAGAGTGAAIGAVGGPLAAVTSGAGAIAGTMGGVSYGMEALFTFGDIILDELGGDPVNLTVENVKKLLSDPKKFKEIKDRSDSRARNIAGTDFAVTLLTLGAGKALLETGKVSKKVVGSLATAAEMTGGSVGEYLGQKASGLGYDASEIVMEGVANLGTSAPITVGKLFNDLQQTANGAKINRNVKANGFADMSDAFKPTANINNAQVDAVNTPMAENVLDSQLENKMRRKIITPVEAKNIKNNFKETQVALKRIKSLGLSTEKQAITATLLKEKINLERTIKQVNDTNLTSTESNRITEINNELRDVVEENKQESVAKETQTKKGQEIDNLAGQKNEDGKYEVTKAEWDSGKADEVITEIYSNDMLTDLIESKIPIEKPPGFSKPDFVSGTIAELIPHIRNFNPEVNSSLSGWINSELKHKVGNVFKKGEAVTKEKFELDVTEQKAIIDNDTSTIEDIIDLKAIEKKETVKAADKLRDITGITVEETVIEGDKILGGKIRTEAVKGNKNPARSDIAKAGKIVFADKIIESFGGVLGTKDNKLGNYITALENQGQDILNVLSDQGTIKNTILNDLYQPNKIDRENTPAGNAVMEYGNPNPKVEDLIAWATNPNLAPTTLINRQRTLANILGGLLGRTSTVESIKTETGKKKLIETQELQGNKMKPNTIAKLIADIDVRIKNLDKISKKYEGTLASGVTPGSIAKVISTGLKIFKQVLIKTKDFAKALKAFIKKVQNSFKTKEEKNIVSEVITEYVKVDNIDNIDIDGMIDSLAEKLNISRGIAYEKVVYKEAEGVKSPIFKVTGTQTEKGGAPDIQFEIAGKEFNVETKLETARYGSLTAKVTSIGDVVFSKDFNFNTELAKAIDSNKKNLKKFRDKAKELGQNMDDFDKGIIDKNIWEQLKNLDGINYLNNARSTINLSSDIIAEIYNKKKPPVNYIQIKGKGLFYLGENPLNLPIPKLESNVDIEVGLNTSGSIKGTNNRRFGIRIKPYKLTNIKQNSNFSIDSKKNIEKLLNTPEVKQLADIYEADVKIKDIKSEGKKFKDSKEGQKIIEKNKEIESQDLSKGFNDIIEVNKGLPSKARYSGIMAKRKGMEKGKYRFFIPPSAEDFKGLLYNFLGKGKTGETQMKWFKEKLIDPYNKGIAQMERYRRALKGDYATLLKQSPNVRKQLGKKIKGADFTYDNAVRAYLWNKDGVEIPGLSKRDTKTLVDAIQNNPEMRVFAEGLQLISKQPTWLKPTASWDVQSITSDIHNFTSREGRKQYLGEFIDNANEIFSKDNLNKIEGVYGTNVKEALQDALYRMETGINRPSGMNRLTNNFNNWVNRSIGAIMFFNRKSALLQTISSVNFVNWSDNNPIKAAAAFANQKQYWSDVVKIFNSPKLKSRRAGLKGDINESELASAAANATNKAEAALSYLLKIGFTPTQLADSFAIATGGATFLRNRINTYKNQNMSEIEAEKQAWKDFSAISEETQQSADPSLISQQQASPLGRLILAFQNTPIQYTRLMKKAGQDLINGRGDAKTHISKIIYYGAVQNFIFAALQNALFAAIPGFSEEDDEEEETNTELIKQRKSIIIANNMVDTVLRGSGVYGAITATLKNTIMKYYENEKKDPFAKDNASILLEAVNLSPPIGSKLR